MGTLEDKTGGRAQIPECYFESLHLGFGPPGKIIRQLANNTYNVKTEGGLFLATVGGGTTWVSKDGETYYVTYFVRATSSGYSIDSFPGQMSFFLAGDGTNPSLVIPYFFPISCGDNNALIPQVTNEISENYATGAYIDFEYGPSSPWNHC